MSKSYQSNFSSRLTISLLPVFTGLWLPFIHLFLLNAGNLTLPLSVHLPILTLMGIIGIGVGLVLQTFSPTPWRTTISFLLLFAGIFFWAESTLLMGNFGFFTGSEIDWAKNQYLLYLEILLVVFLAFLFFKLKTRLLKKSGLITLFLLVSSLANIFPAFMHNMARVKSETEHTFTQEDVFRLSSEKNVLIFILDTYQADLFADIVSNKPHLQEIFDGFTFFPNATSAFPKTYASIPNILTGQAYDNSQPFSNFLQEAYLQRSAPKTLKENGFDVRYLSFTWQPYFAHPDVADNLAGINSHSQRKLIQRLDFIQLANLTVFRLSPFLAKTWAYNQNEFRIRDDFMVEESNPTPYTLTETERVFSRGNTNGDLEFLDRLTSFLATDSDKPTFRIFHLEGIHAQLTLDSELNHIGYQPVTPESYRQQAEGMIKLLAHSFEKLKQSGVYHNSLIFVVGDHGGGEYRRIEVLVEASEKLGLNIKYGPPTEPLHTGLVQGGIPAILVKPIGKEGRLKTALSPVQLGDIPQTIFSELGYSKATAGLSMFDIPDTTARARTHRFYQFAGWNLDYIVPMTEYQVTGFSWNPAAWVLTGRDLNHQAVSALGGKLVILGKSGNMADFSHQGWSDAEVLGRRIEAQTASIVIPNKNGSNSMLLKVKMGGNNLSVNPMPLKVIANQRTIAIWTISRTSPKTAFAHIPDLPSQTTADLNIRFEMDEFPETGLLFKEISVIRSPGRQSYSAGDNISFKLGGNSEPYLQSGWLGPENWGTWTVGYGAMLNLQLDSPPDRSLEMEATFRPALYPGADPMLVDVVRNGETVDHWVLTDKNTQSRSLEIPVHLLEKSRALNICFFIRNPHQSKNFTQKTDSRILGLGFISMTIKERASSTPNGL